MITKGQTVRVRIETLSGESFIEGYPVVVEVIEDMNDGFVACKVLFENDNLPVFRWVDSDDQTNVIQWTEEERITT